MAKQKKRRNKQYTGWDSAQSTPTVHRVKAVKRSKFGQWRHDHRTAIKYWGIALLVILGLVLIIGGIVSLFI